MDIVKNAAEYDAVLAGNKSVFVDFYADWCGPCKMLGPVLEELAAENPDVKFIKVNVDNNPDIAGRYGIMSIPTMLVFKNGEQAGASVGFMPKPQVQELVNKAK